MQAVRKSLACEVDSDFLSPTSCSSVTVSTLVKLIVRGQLDETWRKRNTGVANGSAPSICLKHLQGVLTSIYCYSTLSATDCRANRDLPGRRGTEHGIWYAGCWLEIRQLHGG